VAAKLIEFRLAANEIPDLTQPTPHAELPALGALGKSDPVALG
jgi:hypothetical protein